MLFFFFKCLVFDMCDSEMWAFVDMLLCGLILAEQREACWHSCYVTVRDRQADTADWAAGFCAVGWAYCVSLQDGLVQAAAVWEGLQRFLHQDRHQKGRQVSDGRVKHKCKHKNWWHACRTNMWLSMREGRRFNPLSRPVPQRCF